MDIGKEINIQVWNATDEMYSKIFKDLDQSVGYCVVAIATHNIQVRVFNPIVDTTYDVVTDSIYKTINMWAWN